MSTLNKPAQQWRVRALAAVVILSVCLHLFLPVSQARVGPTAQNRKPDSASEKRGASDRHQTGATEATRPRRVDNNKKDNRESEPLIRIGLMTDVNSIAISSTSGLVVRRSATDGRDDAKISSGDLRIEIRRQPLSVEDPKVYRAEVATVSTLREARKITDKLKKKFFEPASAIYDERAKLYRVLIGEFDNTRQAGKMVERLRREGYQDARIALDQDGDSNRASEEKNSSTKSEGILRSSPSYKAKAASKPTGSKPRSIKKDSAESAPSKLVTQVAAFEANKMIASSEELLIVVATGSESDLKRSGRKPSGHERATEDSTKPPLVRVGKKDYRGELHLALNPRGKINIINVLPLEDYLRSVVPLELPPWSFPEIEALKAQAVAARTYALSHRGRYSKEGFDLRDDARSQVYGGFTAEHPLSNRAVEETRGVVAVYTDEEGRALPIEALYTSTCGGRTEDNEAVFLTRPVPYLRSVECAPDRPVGEGRELLSDAKPAILNGRDGRSVAREVALFEVLDFNLPRPVTSDYLRGHVERSEALEWAERAARLVGRDAPSLRAGDVTRLPAFASLVATAVYGEGRASMLMSQADVDYVLAGFEIGEATAEMRADIAMLMKEGALRLPANDSSNSKAAITRALAIETIARAVSLKSQKASLNFHAGLAEPAEKNRLLVSDANAKRSATSGKKNSEPTGFEVARDARLFRRLGNQSYAVASLALIGGERVTYHLDKDGRVDFLEAELAERGASSDRMSTAARWQERISAQELQRKLARAGARVGEIGDIEPVRFGASNRVIEMDVIGKEGRWQLRGYKIRSALGLKEALFVIDRERDERGRITTFIFTGRGWGHGVGMCQTGAYGLAKEGYSYKDILKKYYTGIKVREMY
ncbi:MAG: SpoIID/LytB domain-containing protein [Blastocatellia bacterium]|nr:SpoIID/LytB domain-containing protein [Blastocatellia bacterium]